MRPRTIWTVFAKEMLETFRDRRTLAVSVFIPILMLPMTMGLFTYFIGDRLPEYRYTLSGGTEADGALLERLLAEESSAVFLRTTPADPEEALRLDDLEVIIVLGRSLAAPGEQQLPVIIHHGAAQESQRAAGLIAARLAAYGERLANQRLAEHGLEPTLIRPLQITLENAMPDRNPSLASIFFPMIVLIWITVGAMYPAADVTAGEKDRRTIGDLLLTPATRLEITLGKFLAVFLMSLVTLIVATVSALVAVEIGDIAALRLDAGGATPVALLWILPTALLTTAIVTALEMIASAFAKSFKEAQTYLTPIFMAVLIPGGLLSISPDLAHKEWLYWVPFMNNTMLIRELLLNVVNPVHITITLLTSLVSSLALLALIVVLFNREDVLFQTGQKGGEKGQALFRLRPQIASSDNRSPTARPMLARDVFLLRAGPLPPTQDTWELALIEQARRLNLDEPLPEGAVILRDNLKYDRPFRLNRSSAQIVAWCNGRRTVAELEQTVVERMGSTAEQAHQAVRDVLNFLAQHGMLESVRRRIRRKLFLLNPLRLARALEYIIGYHLFHKYH